jgi:hypothetical protein
MGARAGLDTVSKRKIPSIRRESKPEHPVVQPVVSRYTDWAILAFSHAILLFGVKERLKDV